MPDWTSKSPWCDPDLVYPVDDIPQPRDGKNRKIILSQAVKVGAGNTLDVHCLKGGKVSIVQEKSPTDAEEEATWRKLLLSAKQLIKSVMPVADDRAVWEILYRLITSGRQEGSLCAVRQTSRVQAGSKFAQMMQEFESGELKSMAELALGNDIQRIGFEQIKNYKELGEHGDLRDQRDLAAQPSAELQGYKIGLVDSRNSARIPNSTEVDDMVIYIKGAAAPCIVRKATAPKAGYLYVGTAYIEGRMVNTVEAGKFETISIV